MKDFLLENDLVTPHAQKTNISPKWYQHIYIRLLSKDIYRSISTLDGSKVRPVDDVARERQIRLTYRYNQVSITFHKTEH